MVSATLRQVTVSPDSLADPSLPPHTRQTSLLGKRPNDENRRAFVKKPAGCTVCGDMSHWWNESEKCRNFVSKKGTCFATLIECLLTTLSNN